MTGKKAALATSKRFDFLVFIGRFQPFHNGHLHVLTQALAQAERVIMLVGSSNQPRDPRNPWSFAERERFIRLSTDEAVQQRLIILPLPDELYNDQSWIKRVQDSVHSVMHQFLPMPGEDVPGIGLIGYGKDRSSYYLALFPQWEAVAATLYKDTSATQLREQYFANGVISDELAIPVKTALEVFRQEEGYRDVAEESRFVQRYKQRWDAAPYPPVFVTADAVVIHSGHILLIERKAHPGKGLWALPGGFIEQDETLQAAMLRELHEETQLEIPALILLDAIVRSQVFDHPQRSQRGRTITHAWLIELKPDTQDLPGVKASDDAAAAFWLPLAELSSERLFEDHFHIINTMTG